MKINNLSDMQIDILREIGNIGAGNAATSLSKLLNRKVDMKVPTIKVVAFDEMIEMIGGPDHVIAATIFRVEGDAPGTVYFIVSIDEADHLVQRISNQELQLYDQQTNQINEMAASILQEIGNILTGSYLSALSDFTQLDMRPSIPYLGIDMAGAIMVDGLLELSQVVDYAIIIDTQITSENHENGVNGQFFLVPDPDSFKQIFTSLGFYKDE